AFQIPRKRVLSAMHMHSHPPQEYSREIDAIAAAAQWNGAITTNSGFGVLHFYPSKHVHPFPKANPMNCSRIASGLLLAAGAVLAASAQSDKPAPPADARSFDLS